jgi:hypothetical protein
MMLFFLSSLSLSSSASRSAYSSLSLCRSSFSLSISSSILSSLCLLLFATPVVCSHFSSARSCLSPAAWSWWFTLIAKLMQALHPQNAMPISRTCTSSALNASTVRVQHARWHHNVHIVHWIEFVVTFLPQARHGFSGGFLPVFLGCC